MKKVLSFVLVLSMILGSFGMAFAAPADVVGEDYEDAVNVLVELGVVAGYKDGTFRPENIVTRAEMATFLIKAMGLADYAVAKSEFSDMAGHWADPFVAYAASLGIVAGYADGTFKPDVTVSYDQAITMVIQALGYKGEYLVGGFPGAFVNQAKALGILKGVVSGAAGANRGDIATLLYNALPKAFVRYDNEGAIQSAGGSMMTRLGAYLLVDENDVVAEFVVDGEEEAVIDMKEYQGALVKAYVNEDGEIIAVEEQTVFVTGDFVTEDGTTTFETADKEYSFKANAQQTGYKYFVNGAEVEDAKALAEFADEEDVVLAVKTSGKYITKVYSASVWNDGVTFQVTEDDVEELAEDNKLDGEEFVMNDEDEIDMDEVVLVGVEALDEIKEDDIVTYYVAGGYVVKVAVSDDVVEGTVKKVNAAGDEVTINGKKYDTAIELELGAEGKFFLACNGKIVAFEGTEPEAKDYAVITVDMEEVTPTAEYGEEEESSVKVKMFTEEGKEAVYVVEEDYAEEIVIGNFTEGTVVTYNLDKNGEIDKIEVVADEDLFEVDGAKLTSKGKLAGKKFADEVVVFVYDAEEDEYALAAKADIKADEDLGNAYFVVNEDGEIAFVVLDAAAGEDAEEVYAVVIAAGKVENEDEETVWEVDVLTAGKEDVLYTVDADVVVPSTTSGALYLVEFEDDAVATFTAIEAEFAEVVAIDAGDIDCGAGFVTVAEDVVVYKLNDDNKFEKAELKDIDEEDFVKMYEVDDDEDEADGVDIIIFKEA